MNTEDNMLSILVLKCFRGCPWKRVNILSDCRYIVCLLFTYIWQLFVACVWSSNGRVELICGSLL